MIYAITYFSVKTACEYYIRRNEMYKAIESCTVLCWSTVCLDTLELASVHLFLWLMKMLSKPA